MAARASLLTIICDNNGSMDYDSLLEISSLIPEAETLDTVISDREFFTLTERNNTKKVIVTTNIKLCKKGTDCQYSCKDLHLCKFHLLGECSRRRCNYGHSLESEHNAAVLRERHLQDLSKEQLRVLLLQSDNTLLPPVCFSYNKGSETFGNCPEKEKCTRLHICENFIRGRCDGSDCTRSHDFYEPHPSETLSVRGIPNQMITWLPSIYRNILAIREHRSARGKYHTNNKENDQKFCTRGKVPESVQKNSENMICLSFVKGYCKYGEKCWRVHFAVPYKWEVEVDQVWMDITENEEVEREYSNPSKMHSKGAEPVCFDTMTQGLHNVRRLSTDSSVLKPDFCLTTKWIWYWEDERRNWIKYESHILSSISSEELEQRYLLFLSDNSSAVVQFSAGRQSYELSFRDMKQKNVKTGTERAIKRRPFFVSSFDVQVARSSKTKRSVPSSSHKGVPGFWDKTAVPETGYKRVPLSPENKDYIRVQENFNKTMSDFSILNIERVQNKELWEDFQTKRERMKKANEDKKYGEGGRLLFHGTKLAHIHDICRQNIDMRVCGANGTVYGQGSYFAKDARYSHEYTDRYGERSMFVCRVLVGEYTKGLSSYRRPPTKDNIGTLYDSCVNDVRNPTIFVVFDRSQVYPEFLVTYDNKRLLAAQSDCPVAQALSQVAISDTNPAIKPSTLSHVNTNNLASDTSNMVKTLPSVTTASSLEERLSAAEPALLTSTNTTLRNSDNVLHSREIYSTQFLSDMIKDKTSSPFFAKSKDVLSTNPTKCSAQLNFSRFQEEAAKELPKATKTLVFSKTDLSGNAAHSSNARSQTAVTSSQPHDQRSSTSSLGTTSKTPDIVLGSREGSSGNLSSTHSLSDLIKDKTPTSSLVFEQSKDVRSTNIVKGSTSELNFSRFQEEAAKELPKATQTLVSSKTELSGNTAHSCNPRAQTSSQLHDHHSSTSSLGTSEKQLQTCLTIPRYSGHILGSGEGSSGNFSELIPERRKAKETLALPKSEQVKSGLSGNTIDVATAKAQTAAMSRQLHDRCSSTSRSGTSERQLQTSSTIPRSSGYLLGSGEGSSGNLSELIPELRKAKEMLALSKSEQVKTGLLGNAASAKAQTAVTSTGGTKIRGLHAVPNMRQASQTSTTLSRQAQATSSVPNSSSSPHSSIRLKRESQPDEFNPAVFNRQKSFTNQELKSIHELYKVPNTTKFPKEQKQKSCVVQ